MTCKFKPIVWHCVVLPYKFLWDWVLFEQGFVVSRIKSSTNRLATLVNGRPDLHAWIIFLISNHSAFSLQGLWKSLLKAPGAWRPHHGPPPRYQKSHLRGLRHRLRKPLQPSQAHQQEAHEEGDYYEPLPALSQNLHQRCYAGEALRSLSRADQVWRLQCVAWIQKPASSTHARR